jgi:hypothetical protein
MPILPIRPWTLLALAAAAALAAGSAGAAGAAPATAPAAPQPAPKAPPIPPAAPASAPTPPRCIKLPGCPPPSALAPGPLASPFDAGLLASVCAADGGCATAKARGICGAAFMWAPTINGSAGVPGDGVAQWCGEICDCPGGLQP